MTFSLLFLGMESTADCTDVKSPNPLRSTMITRRPTGPTHLWWWCLVVVELEISALAARVDGAYPCKCKQRVKDREKMRVLRWAMQ